MKRLCSLARGVSDALDSARYKRFQKREVVKLIIWGITKKLVVLDELPPKIQSAVKDARERTPAGIV